LQELFSYLRKMNVSSVELDVSLARGLAYYTGTVYEAFAQKSEVTSSLAAGGRWDDMIGKFMGREREVPAVGIAFGLVPVMEVLKEKQKLKQKTVSKAYVIPINTVKESLQIVQQLRREGIPTDFSLGKKGLSKNLQYADALGIPYAMIIGEKELKMNKVLLRDMVSGTEQMLSVSEILKKLK